MNSFCYGQRLHILSFLEQIFRFVWLCWLLTFIALTGSEWLCRNLLYTIVPVILICSLCQYSSWFRQCHWPQCHCSNSKGSIQWRHNGHDGVSNHQPHDCLLNRLCADQICSASLAFVRGIHRWPVNSPQKWPVTRKMFPFDDVIMTWVEWINIQTMQSTATRKYVSLDVL